MNYNIIPTPYFEKELKKLAKKYKSIKLDFFKLGTQLSNNPFLGTSLGNDCYKVRMAITDKKKGKSAGARVIIQVKIINQKFICFLFMISRKKQIYCPMS